MAMKTICIVNMKGGVGKTTICLNLAHWLVKRKNKKVLVIDFDPQANASEGLLSYSKYETHLKNKKVISDIFTDLRRIVTPVGNSSRPEIRLEDMVAKVFNSGNGGLLHLIPSELELCHILERPISRLAEDRLKIILRGKKEKYDFILIDCGPTYSLLTTNALNASDLVLIPVKPDPFSTRGIPLMIRQIEEHSLGSTEEDRVKLLGIVFTIVKDKRYVDSIKGEVLKVNPGVFQSELLSTEYYPISLINNSFILESRANNRLKNNFIEFANEFMEKIEKGV